MKQAVAYKEERKKMHDVMDVDEDYGDDIHTVHDLDEFDELGGFAFL